MNEQNSNNIIVIDRISKNVLNEPNIEIDEEIYAEAVSKLVEKLLVGLRRGENIKKDDAKECIFISKAKEKID